MIGLDILPKTDGGEVHSLYDMLVDAPKRMRQSFWGAEDFVYPNGDRHFEVAADPAHDILRKIAEEERRISYGDFFSLSIEIQQIIWASMPGFDVLEDEVPWIVMSAVDSSFWRFETDDIETCNWVRAKFENVVERPR